MLFQPLRHFFEEVNQLALVKCRAALRVEIFHRPIELVACHGDCFTIDLLKGEENIVFVFHITYRACFLGIMLIKKFLRALFDCPVEDCNHQVLIHCMYGLALDLARCLLRCFLCVLMGLLYLCWHVLHSFADFFLNVFALASLRVPKQEARICISVFSSVRLMSLNLRAFDNLRQLIHYFLRLIFRELRLVLPPIRNLSLFVATKLAFFREFSDCVALLSPGRVQELMLGLLRVANGLSALAAAVLRRRRGRFS